MNNRNSGLIYPNRSFSKSCLRIINKHLILLILCISFIPFLYINGAALSGIDEGITAFRKGNYTSARAILTEYVDCGGEKETLVKAYLFAMKDEAKVKPSEAVISIIQKESGRGDPIFQVLEGRLHLMGLLVESNRERGLSLLHSASGRREGYAYYTLGLLYSGRFGEEGDLGVAESWYKTAMRQNFHEAMGRMSEIREALDRLEVATGGEWDGGSTWDDGSEILSDRKGGDHDVGGGAGVGSSRVIGRRLERGEDKKGLEEGSLYTRTTVGGGAAGGAGAHPTAETGTIAGPIKEEDNSKPVAAGGAESHGSTTGPSSTQVINIGATAEDLSSVVGGDARPVVSGGAEGSIVPIPPAVPAIAVGHEAIYQRFMEGRLEYRPYPNGFEMITLPFRDILAPIAGTDNPLSATFDLSRCGVAGKYISIHTGYKKSKIPTNAGKVEVWLCPKFLVERELDTFKADSGWFSSPKHPFAHIMSKWESPIGLVWTRGGDEVASYNFDYLLKGKDMINYAIWLDKRHFGQIKIHLCGSPSSGAERGIIINIEPPVHLPHDPFRGIGYPCGL